mgnify:CR=1 FL=1
MCMEFNAKLYFEPPTVAFGRQAQLSFMAYFNESDSVGGFNQLLTGLPGLANLTNMKPTVYNPNICTKTRL